MCAGEYFGTPMRRLRPAGNSVGARTPIVGVTGIRQGLGSYHARAPVWPPRKAALAEWRAVFRSAAGSNPGQQARGRRSRSCEPYFDPPPVLIRVSRLGAGALDPGPEPSDWALTSPVVELLDEFARIRDGMINRLEFRHGLPALLETTIPARPESSSDMSRGS